MKIIMEIEIVKFNKTIYQSAIVVKEDGKLIIYNPIPEKYRKLIEIL